MGLTSVAVHFEWFESTQDRGKTGAASEVELEKVLSIWMSLIEEDGTRSKNNLFIKNMHSLGKQS
jgi:hypothetical protein